MLPETSKTVEDAALAHLVKDEMGARESCFDHHLTLSLNNGKDADATGYKWQVLRIGVCDDALYVVVIGYDGETVAAYDVADFQGVLDSIADFVSHRSWAAEVRKTSGALKELVVVPDALS